MIICDLESDGLLPELTRIHCAVMYNTEKDIWKEFTPANIHEFPDFLSKAPVSSFHNGVCFDIPAIEKVSHRVFTGVVFDTLLASRILFPDLPGKAPHSVDSYGQRFGIEKPKHEDWTTYTPEMLHRCREDVKIQARIYKHIIDTIDHMAILDSRITNDKFFEIVQFEQRIAQIIEQQAKNGFAFDLRRSYEVLPPLDKIIQDISDELLPRMPARLVRDKDAKVTKAFNKNGNLSANAVKWVANSLYPVDVMGDFCKVKFKVFNLNSSSQIKDYLYSFGWKPTKWNYKKDDFNKNVRDKHGKLIKMSPKLPKIEDEFEWDEIERLTNNDNVRLLCKYNKARHRRSQIEGFIRNLRDDHRLEAQANTCGTNTARMQHRIVVNVPKADPDVFYGKEMRSLFVASEGKVLVGIDAKALEARVEAHYIYPFDPAGSYELVDGDIHAKNAIVWDVTRNGAKPGKYSLTYGASANKLAATLGKPANQGKALYDAFWEANIGLKTLKEMLEGAYDKRGYILAIDGRPLTIRYKHALINTLFQSCGSIVMKRALIILHDDLKRAGITYWFVGNFHDEWQIECYPQDAEAVGKMACEAITKAGGYYDLNVTMEGDYKVGLNWSLTH